jgi:predicted transcriptional regulator
MKVLLAIKEEFANKIFDGSKKYEFRKSLFKDRRVKTIVVYVSSPVQKVVGEFEIDGVISDAPSNLWSTTRKNAGISKSFFDSYFDGRTIGHAIKIKKTKTYTKPKCLREDFNMSFAPQSYVYLNKKPRKSPF